MHIEAKTKPQFIATFRFVWASVCLWSNRASQRRDLLEMDNDQLRDLNISPEERRRECKKPFWRE
jgi:uncharacterized protein YjiS (DUF1127 family)